MRTANRRLNVLIGLNSFAIFMVLFAHHVDVPAWLQVIGRMHPMLLHFPIVLLLFAGVLINVQEKISKSFPAAVLIYELLFAGALSVALTAIAGLLLANEGGYEGHVFQWHKWTGIIVSFLALVLFGGYGSWMKNSRAMTLMVTNGSMVLLLAVGHFGASLTHGESFLFDPLRKSRNEVFDVSTARVFEEAIMPVLRAKCLSCHNTGKPKGGLALTDAAAMQRGGDHTPLLVNGVPSESLLIQRLLLDIDHEHRMPPKGKPQLTAEELALLRAWVAHGATFDMPVAALSESDSLLAAIHRVYLVSAGGSYDFPPADAGLVAKLTTPYRAVKPVADGSPALTINVFGAGSYSPESLAGLKPIAEQIVALNVSGMPIGKADLEVVRQFVNLRKINLNNTPIDDESLEVLQALSKLVVVSLVGTGVTVNGLQKLLESPKVKQVFVWNTAIGKDEIAHCKSQYPDKEIDGEFDEAEGSLLRLTAPQILPARTFFRDELEVALHHPIPGVEIRYALDGREPDSLSGLVFEQPFTINKDQQLAVKAYKPGWLSSEVIARHYVKSPIQPGNVKLLTNPHYLYPARRELSLFDLASGGDNHADGKWIGYHQSALAASCHFDTPTNIDTLIVSVLQNYTGITYMPAYPPEQVEVWGGADAAHAVRLATIKPPLSRPEQLARKRLIYCPINASDVRYIKLEVQPYQHIPADYPGTGMAAWLFVDEIILK